MEYKNQRQRYRDWLRELAVLCLLAALGYYVNRHIKIKGLYMDDLYMWSCYGEQSFLEFAFPFQTSTRFRPVYWIATYLEMMVVRNHPELFVPINILLNVGVGYFIYRFGRRLTGAVLPGAVAGGMYLISHFAYYQIGQALGLLETMALFMALVVLYYLLRYLKEGKKSLFLGGCFTYFLLVFSHERYLALFPLFYLVLFFREMLMKRGRGRASERGAKSRRRIGKEDSAHFLLWALPLIELIGIVLLRRLFIGSALPAGTGGTEVTDTFSLSQALEFSVSQVLYIFGVNAGPEYLAGIPWEEVSGGIRKLVYLSWLPLAVIALGFLLMGIRRKAFQAQFIGENLLFLGFIALCIGCSSITIRVEMRWIYVSFAAALLYLCYMIGELGEWCAVRKRNYDPKRRKLAVLLFSILFVGYAALMAPVERYYRMYYPKIYFWENQDRMNSLAEQTVEKYGAESVLGKQVYILENSYEMTEFYGETFFKVYDRERTGQGTRIHFISNETELPASANRENSIVLRERPELRGYEDITEEIFS